MVLALLAWSVLIVQPCGPAFAATWGAHPFTAHAEPYAAVHSATECLGHACRLAEPDAVHHCHGLPHDRAHCLTDSAYAVALAGLAKAEETTAAQVNVAFVVNVPPVLNAVPFDDIPSAPARASPLNRQYLHTLRLRL